MGVKGVRMGLGNLKIYLTLPCYSPQTHETLKNPNSGFTFPWSRVPALTAFYEGMQGVREHVTRKYRSANVAFLSLKAGRQSDHLLYTQLFVGYAIFPSMLCIFTCSY